MKTPSVVLLFALTVAAVAAWSSPARAATCPPPPASVHPFLPWQDSGSYVLTTGGAFEAGDPAWTLSGGAGVVSGDSAAGPLDPSTDSHALYLPAGAVATSACVTAPQIRGVVRFFAKSATGGQLRVEILVKGGVYEAGVIDAGGAWAPTPILPSNAPYYSGAVTYRIRLVALSGSFTVDDVYFDPSKSF
jgi:hypothetical protein